MSIEKPRLRLAEGERQAYEEQMLLFAAYP